jgi:hypothetical protein
LWAPDDRTDPADRGAEALVRLIEETKRSLKIEEHIQRTLSYHQLGAILLYGLKAVQEKIFLSRGFSMSLLSK